MPLKLDKVDNSFRSGYLRIHYLDEFGQPRFFEFGKVQSQDDIACFAQELIQQVNELLTRPRPKEWKPPEVALKDLVDGVQKLKLLPDDIEYVNGVPTIR